MKPTVYLETSIIGYLTAWIARDLVAAVHGMNYLLTWNCTHIANAALRKRIDATCHTAGYEPPVICTPQELLGLEASL